MHSRRNIARFSCRRALVGAALVLHVMWLSVSAMPAAAAAGQRDQSAIVAAQTLPMVMADMAGMPCHDMNMASDTGTACHSQSFGCDTQCHCLSGLCVVIMPAMTAASLSNGRLLAPAFMLPAPLQALFDFELRPPIAS